MSSPKYPPTAAFELTLSAVPDDVFPESGVQGEVLLLFDECAPRLRRYARSCGLTAEAAEDVVQEAFLSLFRHLSLGGSRRNLRGWLFQVSYRMALKHRERLARRQRHEAPLEPYLADSVADPTDDPEVQLADHQRRRRLRKVVQALPERDRQCLYLRAEGLPYRDIAKTLEISLGTVAKSLAHAVMRLSNAVRE